MSKPYAVVWDLGNVLIRWDPRNLYRKYFGSDIAAMEQFLNTICTPAWNEQQDAGRSISEAVAALLPIYPRHESLIRAFYDEWEQMLAGPIDENVALLTKLHARRVPIYALSNWSAETFPRARPHFPFLGLFHGVVLSGLERLIKPDPRLYQVLLRRYGLDATRCIFIDDALKNVDAARQLGMTAIHYHPTLDLERELKPFLAAELA